MCFIYFFCLYPLYAYLERSDRLPHIPLTLFFYTIPVLVLAFVFFSSLLHCRYVDRKGFRLLFLILFIFIYILMVVFFNSSFWSFEVTQDNLAAIVYMVFAFIVGFYLSRLDRYSKYILGFYWGVSMFWLLHVDYSVFLIDFSRFKTPEAEAIYLKIGEGYAILAILGIYVSRSKKYLPAIISLLSIPILFFINSRASLFIYIMVLMFPFFTLSNWYRYSLIFSFVVVCFLILSYVNIDFILDSRVLRLIFNTEEDTSLQLRNDFMDRELLHLWKNWFWGDYSNYILREGEGGSIHNYLAFWAQYGFMPFLCMCMLFVCFMVFNIRQWLKYHSQYIFNIMLFSFALIAAWTAKSYSYQLIWVVLGMSLREYLEFRHKSKISYYLCQR